MFRVRLLLMGLLSALAIGMTAAAAATAEAGPFWHQREGGKGSGVKIEQSKPVAYSGQGKVKFNFFIMNKLAGILDAEIQIKGGIWNEANQGQLKAQVKFEQVRPPGEPACKSETKVPENYQGHLMWKWNGETKQLEESSQAQQKWDIMLTPGQTKLDEKGLSGKNILATVSFGASCGSFSNTTQSFKGAMIFAADAGLEAFHNTFTFIGSLPLTFVTPFDTHYWNGKGSIGLEENLFFEAVRSGLAGEFPVKFGQEVAVFEK